MSRLEVMRPLGVRAYLRDPDSGREYGRTVAGWAWPSAVRPGFIVAVGESRRMQQDPRKRLRYFHYALDEFESGDLEELFKRLLVWHGLYRLDRVYGDPSHQANMQWLRIMQRSFKRRVYPVAAPFVQLSSLQFFVNIIRRSVSDETKRFFLEGSAVLRGYLDDLPESLLGHTPENWPALAALGYCLAGLRNSVPHPRPPVRDEYKPLDPIAGY